MADRLPDGVPASLAELNSLIAVTGPRVPGSTQVVLGEGPLRPLLAFVGEQPGHQEDLQGRPFVGPAGQLLTRAMASAGIARSKSYLTNAVKNFKYEQRGKRRLHKSPTAGEIKRYRWWLIRELELVKPRLIIALGRTATYALAGKALSIAQVRGPFEFEIGPGFVTVHPSYLLRITGDEAKATAYAAFVADLAEARTIAAIRRKRGSRADQHAA